ncbi:hypothetical protein GJ496_011772 [Pomphorhynchus laevis]|nr:hypothetical protein GJ496_011772 [Pomphorhynchus laevis]
MIYFDLTNDGFDFLISGSSRDDYFSQESLRHYVILVYLYTLECMPSILYQLAIVFANVALQLLYARKPQLRIISIIVTASHLMYLCCSLNSIWWMSLPTLTCLIPFMHRRYMPMLWTLWIVLSIICSYCPDADQMSSSYWSTYSAIHMHLSLRALMLSQFIQYIPLNNSASDNVSYLLDYVGLFFGPVITPVEWKQLSLSTSRQHSQNKHYHQSRNTSNRVYMEFYRQIRNFKLLVISCLDFIGMRLMADFVFLFIQGRYSSSDRKSFHVLFVMQIIYSIGTRLSHYSSLKMADMVLLQLRNTMTDYNNEFTTFQQYPICRIAAVEQFPKNLSCISRNWNINIHSCLKKSVYQPFCQGYNRTIIVILKARLLIVLINVALHGIDKPVLLINMSIFHILLFIEHCFFANIRSDNKQRRFSVNTSTFINYLKTAGQTVYATMALWILTSGNCDGQTFSVDQKYFSDSFYSYNFIMFN